jgi:hypothetical protein
VLTPVLLTDLYVAPHFGFFHLSPMDARKKHPTPLDESATDQFLPNDSKPTTLPSLDHGDEFSQDDAEALLEPCGKTLTHQGLRPLFSEEAMMVMAIFQAKQRQLTRLQVQDWIRSNFDLPHHDINSVGRSYWLYCETHAVVSVYPFSFRIHAGLKRTLEELRDFNGYPFDPSRHIDYYIGRLSSVQPSDQDNYDPFRSPYRRQPLLKALVPPLDSRGLTPGWEGPHATTPLFTNESLAVDPQRVINNEAAGSEDRSMAHRHDTQLSIATSWTVCDPSPVSPYSRSPHRISNTGPPQPQLQSEDVPTCHYCKLKDMKACITTLVKGRMSTN